MSAYYTIKFSLIIFLAAACYISHAQQMDQWSMAASMRDITHQQVSAHRNVLDDLGYYQLDWDVNYHANSISFTLEINTNKSGFQIGSDIFALGLSERGELQSSDFCLIWFDLSHRVHLQDARTDPFNILHLVESTKSVCKLSKRYHQQARDTELDDEEGPNQRASSDLSEIDQQEEKQRSEFRRAATESTFEISFKRPLDVCDEKQHGHHYTIDNGTTHLVWFALKGPLLALDGLNLAKYTQASTANHPDHQRTSANHSSNDHKSNFAFGLRRAQLIASKPHAIGQQHAKMDIRMDKYAVPARETTYWCKLFKLPERFERRRYHITSYEAAIELGMEHVVHHMELFNCANLSPTGRAKLEHLYHSRGGWSGECSGPERPPETDSCKRVILAWAMGARPLVYPEQVGQSIGGPEYSPFVVLEVHYNNVQQASGLVDSSGLRFHYTPRLRPYDAGILEVGLEYTDKNSIPPQMLVPLAGHCVSECTRVAMSQDSSALHYPVLKNKDQRHSLNQDAQARITGEEDAKTINARQDNAIYIFAAQMHTHLTGVASWTEHVRTGQLLGELQRDDHYSPHFQEIRLLPRQVRLEPGDALIHYCLYDTRQRENITLGGFATADEMCVTYLHYYPKIDLEVCKSSVDSTALASYFDQLAREEAQNTTASRQGFGELDQSNPEKKLKSVSENYRSIEWSARRSRELIEFYQKAPLSVQCNRSDGHRWPGSWEGHQPTRLIREPAAQFQPGLTRPPREESRSNRDSFDYYRPPSVRELVAYRGLGHAARHARCLRGPA